MTAAKRRADPGAGYASVAAACCSCSAGTGCCRGSPWWADVVVESATARSSQAGVLRLGALYRRVIDGGDGERLGLGDSLYRHGFGEGSVRDGREVEWRWGMSKRRRFKLQEREVRASVRLGKTAAHANNERASNGSEDHHGNTKVTLLFTKRLESTSRSAAASPHCDVINP